MYHYDVLKYNLLHMSQVELLGPHIIKQAHESLAVAMSLGDIVTSWADCYKKSLETYNFNLQLCALWSMLNPKFLFQALTYNIKL